MAVRDAKFTDIPRITELLVEAHTRSIYKDDDVNVDVKHTKGLLMSAMQRHRGKGEGASCVLVSENNGVVEGIIVGVVCRIQEIGDKFFVTDLLFYQSGRALPSDARMLLQGVVSWAKTVKNVFEVTFGVSDVIGDYTRTAKLYERMGMTQNGVMYGMRTGI